MTIKNRYKNDNDPEMKNHSKKISQFRVWLFGLLEGLSEGGGGGIFLTHSYIHIRIYKLFWQSIHQSNKVNEDQVGRYQ